MLHFANQIVALPFCLSESQRVQDPPYFPRNQCVIFLWEGVPSGGGEGKMGNRMGLGASWIYTPDQCRSCVANRGVAAWPLSWEERPNAAWWP